MLRAATRTLNTAAVTRAGQTTVQHPFFVPRNSRGSLPVYTDVRNGGGRYFVQIRNVEGDAHALAKALRTDLFPKDSPEAGRLTVDVKHARHLTITGGRWKQAVSEWLISRGF
ncbi:mitochondrial large subunit ribosomal protein-domain-containing protein [Schizophyllum amplum]|uniref:Large ribosomal subunit protein mL49 n=1 Tax=Schizophyllum amplum TaxID=97359 RepID=A0A550CD23_9AGAR|nr:mitochondrial large subunit ribosomal protein-domain-containing protein [Auriculariopsis ampla]